MAVAVEQEDTTAGGSVLRPMEGAIQGRVSVAIETSSVRMPDRFPSATEHFKVVDESQITLPAIAR